MHDGMPYDPIQGQRSRLRGFSSSENCTLPSLSPLLFAMGAGKWHWFL